MFRAGTFKDVVGSESCTACSPGTYSLPWRSFEACDDCPVGYYQPDFASTACFACPLEWLPFQAAVASTSAAASREASACGCTPGHEGHGNGFAQDRASQRPVFLSNGGRLQDGVLSFDRSTSAYLHYGKRNGTTWRVFTDQETWNLSSNGALTIVAEVKFQGYGGTNERILDFGNALYRYYDSIVLSRWQNSTQLYFTITNKVTLLS